jgi:hypothetical protein
MGFGRCRWAAQDGTDLGKHRVAVDAGDAATGYDAPTADEDLIHRLTRAPKDQGVDERSCAIDEGPFEDRTIGLRDDWSPAMSARDQFPPDDRHALRYQRSFPHPECLLWANCGR